ncbi:mandelate racemase/muconate lactonizing enzyme family protein [Microvirga calopogonii]|uniref:mandelate racemase/muconate lactonizing enzyme family protein n=1 Tax=Microvirga calopogonii TaxID=2078013 RepID=UPI000E0CF5F8|nr:mandelate racemase/muconate lactonizing enzyme family protein [Microvirga calopogonii]
MNPVRIRLFEGFLRYPRGQEVHTAASGRIDALHELFLVIDDLEGSVTGQGEVRTNIAFITGTPEHEVAPKVVELLTRIADVRSAGELQERFEQVRTGNPKIAQALIENTLVDLEARRRGISMAEYLGGVWKAGIPCNECVFWGADEDMRANVASYLAQGFTRIKVRVGIGAIEDDIRRIGWLRDCYGDQIDLAIDANGAWDAETALHHIEQLARFGIQYVEQPTYKGDWAALERVARECGIETMIDEGLQTMDDVDRVCANEGRISAHLKIAKAGGVAALVAIGRRFDEQGIAYVVGQMNEGGLATAAAVQAAMALSPRVGELYGALGIENDPCAGVTYHNGRVAVPPGPGTGVSIRPDGLTLLWESNTR